MSTATILAANIEDAYVENPTDSNNGGRVGITFYRPSGAGDTRALYRIASAQIPAGTISAGRLYVYAYDYGGLAFSIAAYKVLSANGWVCGTASGAMQAGSCDWNHAKHDTQAWAGSAGCSTSGTDFEADASPPTVSINAVNSWFVVPLKAAWLQAWRDTPAQNNGIVIGCTVASGSKYASVRSASAASNKPYVEVDYVAGPTTSLLAQFNRRRR